MSINFNQWLIDLAGQTSTTPRAYDQKVDYVLHVKDQVLTPAQVNARVAAYRSAGHDLRGHGPRHRLTVLAGAGAVARPPPRANPPPAVGG